MLDGVGGRPAGHRLAAAGLASPGTDRRSVRLACLPGPVRLQTALKAMYWSLVRAGCVLSFCHAAETSRAAAGAHAAPCCRIPVVAG